MLHLIEGRPVVSSDIPDCCELDEHAHNMHYPEPCAQTSYKIFKVPISMKEKVETELIKLIEKGIIVPAESDFFPRL